MRAYAVLCPFVLLLDLCLFFRSEIVLNVEAEYSLSLSVSIDRKIERRQREREGTHSLRISSGCLPLIMLATVLHPTSLFVSKGDEEVC